MAEHMSDPQTAEKKVEDWLCYMANDKTLSTEHQRDMSAMTLQVLAKQRADLVKAQQLAMRPDRYVRQSHRVRSRTRRRGFAR